VADNAEVENKFTVIEQGAFTTINIEVEVVTLAFLLTRWEKEVLINLKSWKVEHYKVALISRELDHLPLNQISSSLLATCNGQVKPDTFLSHFLIKFLLKI